MKKRKVPEEEEAAEQVGENLEFGGLKGGETTLKALDCEKKEEYFHPRTLLQTRNSLVKLNVMKKGACERYGKNLLTEVAIGRGERRVPC